MTEQSEENLTTDVAAAPSPLFFACLGASAGGIHAVETFFSNSSESGHPVCYVLIIHSVPDHVSLLPDLLARHTELPVLEVKDGLKPEAEKIYFIPGNRMVNIDGGVFLVSETAIANPIDFFLKSLAADQGGRAIAIILSGAGSDGSAGIREIRANGGLVMVQESDSALHSGMPLSAAATQSVDLVLNPSQMQRYIQKWIRNPTETLRLGKDSLHSTAIDLQRILFILKASSGHDFTLYKRNTIKRRLEKRLIVQGIDTLSDYVLFLENNAQERVALLSEILIGVTSFFRDEGAFEVLKRDIVPHLLKDVGSEKSLRVWIPGCSTGQEAYSIAMIILETFQNSWDFDLKIFASDIDKEAIDFARDGIYPVSIAEDVSKERLQKFFTLGPDGYQIKKEVKDRIIFAYHNIARDPPFSKLDMISCRNLMIYMEPILQQKILRIFHYSLNPGGILFLGSSETVGDSNPLFGAFDKKWKFFERRTAVVPAHRRMDFESFLDITPATPELRAPLPISPRKIAVREFSQEALLQEFVPPSIVCDELGEILFIHGRTGRYLEPSPGEARLNIFSMARDEIKLELSRGFQKVLATNSDVRFTDLRFHRENDTFGLDISLRLLKHTPYPGRMVIVTFEESTLEPMLPENAITFDPNSIDERNVEVERELLFTREHMQTLVEQLENSNEELKSMNEELQSSNEELQSSNEELETAKEELQAVNEELVTLNAELQEKIEELSMANNDLDNFLSSSSIATIFLDRRFYITRFSRSTSRIFNLIPSDVGRSLGDIASKVKYDGVLEDAEEVLENLSSIEKMVELKDGRWLLMKISPYKTADNVIDGVVIGFSDISEQRKLESVSKILQSMTNVVGLAVIIYDSNAQILFASKAMQLELGLSWPELRESNLSRIGLKAEDKTVDIAQTPLPNWKGLVTFTNKDDAVVRKSAELIVLEESFSLRCLFLLQPE